MNAEDKVREVPPAYKIFREITQIAYRILRQDWHPDATEAEIQYQLGMKLYARHASLEDDVEAAQMFALAVQDNHVEAQYVLGVMLVKGEGGRTKNEEGGARLLRLAASQGHEKAKKWLIRLDEEAQETVRLLGEYLKKHPNDIKSKSANKKSEKKIEQEEKPKAKQEKSSTQEIPPTKKITLKAPLTIKVTPKTLFCNELQVKTEELNKMRSAIVQARKLQETIVQHIKTSADRLVQPLEGLPENKSRLLGLEANLMDLRTLETYVVSIKASEEIIDRFLELLMGLQGKASDKENLKLQEKFENIFTVEKFLTLREASAKNENIKDEVFDSGLIALKEKWDLLLVPADKIVAKCIGMMESLIVVLKKRVERHLEFKVRVPELGKKEAAESEAFLALGKVPAIKDTFQKIVLQELKVALLSTANEEKTAQDCVVQHSQKTSSSEDSGNERSEPVRRVARAAREQDPQPADREPQEENVLLAPKKLSKAARKAYYTQQQAAKRAQVLQKEQARARACKLEAVLAGAEVFLPCEIKKVQEEKTKERQSPLFKEKTIESHKELQKLKSIIRIITETGVWTRERKYAVLQSFAFLNEVISEQHEHLATKKVSKCLRNAIFKQYKEVMNIVQSPANLLGMVNAWIMFLETPDEMCSSAKEKAVLSKVSSELLSKIYRFGEALSKETDIRKSCVAFEEMMHFGNSQCYETECNIRLVSEKIGEFENFVEREREIVIVRNQSQDTITVFYKNKNSCEIARFNCSQVQQELFLNLTFNNERLDKNESTQEVYKQIYMAVTLREGSICSGDDIIGCEAARFYWAITGSELVRLDKTAKIPGEDNAKSLLIKFVLERSEHLKRGRKARHFKPFETVETKNSNECVDTDFTVLLFAQNMQPPTSPCLLDIANGHSANLPNGQPHPSVSPVVPAVASPKVKGP